MGTDTWDSTPAGGDTWKADDSGAGWAQGGGDGWKQDGGASGDGFAAENVSKHANDTDMPRDGGCRICGEEGHFARDCDKNDRPRGCFNCGEEGHNKSDCPNPTVEREFTGECRVCNEAGHRAKDCPQAPPMLCKLCKGEGHIAADCDANRMLLYFASLGIEEVPAAEAYEKMIAADKALGQDKKDMELQDELKRAVFTYCKTTPTAWVELEELFRANDMNSFLIAKQIEVEKVYTITNLQGEGDKEYVVSFETSAKPRRKIASDAWPASPEENIERLGNAGLPMDRGVMKCNNCDELGHGSKNCPQDKMEREVAAPIECGNCGSDAHRLRDCPEPRKTRGGGCKNCGQDGHIAKECPEPPNLDNVECKNCSQMGHFSRDCPDRQPMTCRNCGEEGHRASDCDKERVMKCRNCDEEGHSSRECPHPKDMSRVQCRNCDEMGHQSRECPKPTDWSRVTCSSCQEKGHSYKRCPNPAAATDGGDSGWGDSGGAAVPAAGGSNDWNGGNAGGGGSGWDDGGAGAASGGGGW